MIYLLIISGMSLMFLIQGYKEEIFSRLEKSGFNTLADIKQWLAGPKKVFGKDVEDQADRRQLGYKNLAIELEEVYDIRNQLEQYKDNPEKLKEVKRQAETVDSGFGKYRNDLIADIEVAQADLEKDVQVQEREIIETEEEIQSIDEEITETSEEIEGLQSIRIAAEQEEDVGARVETIEKNIEDRELTIEEREKARNKLQDKIKEMTRKRGR